MANIGRDELHASQNVSAGKVLRRTWVIPILRALRDLGGSASPKATEKKIRELYRDEVTDLQFAHVLKTQRIRFDRFEMSKKGLIGGVPGRWDLTDAGSAYLEHHENDPIDFTSIPELSTDDSGSLDEVETVKTTALAAFEIPVLRALQDGHAAKQAILEAVVARHQDQWLPGDFRTMSNGHEVLRYRASWMLTTLKNSGLVRNPARGLWEITDVGKRRLEEAESTWNIQNYQDSESKVRVGGRSTRLQRTGAEAGSARMTPRGVLGWNALAERFPDAHEQLHRRLRPDLGATPALKRQIARNAILYGPPGTGKTFVAKLVAQALTGNVEPGPDSAWRIVQFHPSYSYEDFIQGLRPDLQHGGGKFELRTGPFLQICSEAEEDPDRFYVLIIDEINRGDPARIFGELLYAIEYRDESVELALGGQLKVPPNLIILGTMNSVDRSVALVDYALRRRFGFVRVDPEPEVLLEVRGGEEGATIAASVLEAFNKWLERELDREHVLGHSFFLDPALPLTGIDALNAIWEDSVRPLLEEYLYGDVARMIQAAEAWKQAIEAAVAKIEEVA